VFASAEGSSELATRLVLRSVRNGRIVRRLGQFGEHFTNNGLAMTPDARAVYLTLTPHRHGWANLLIERVSVSTRRRSVVAHGWEPSLSPDGRLLGYISYHGRAESINVKDLATGQTRSVNVDAILGAGHVLAETPPGWIGDGTTLAVPITLPPRANAGSARPAASTAGQGSQTPLLRLAAVSVPATGALSAHAITVSGLREYAEMLSADTSTPNTLLDVGNANDNSAPLEQITLSGSGASACRLLEIPHALVLGFDPRGQQLLYVGGSRPPATWRATIDGTHLTARYRYPPNRAGTIAW
jgi:hypothetical protein